MRENEGRKKEGKDGGFSCAAAFDLDDCVLFRMSMINRMSLMAMNAAMFDQSMRNGGTLIFK